MNGSVINIGYAGHPGMYVRSALHNDVSHSIRAKECAALLQLHLHVRTRGRWRMRTVIALQG